MDEDTLKREIEIELENLARLVREMKYLTEKFINNEPDFIQTRAAGSIVHDFYCGIEKIFERISIQIDRYIPKGFGWHTELLLQMTQSREGTRSPIINKELMENLKEYLRFRHLFRHIYGFELKWNRFKELALSLDNLLAELKKNLKSFLT
jgi:hypothetical protein